MNYLGTLNNNISQNQGGNFGYPQCYSAWDVSSLPNNANIQVGTQFAIDDEFAAGYATAADDALCLQRVAPRLVFQAHMAPLAILFNNAGTEAWITFHGSWDRTSAIVSSHLHFASGTIYPQFGMLMCVL